MGRWEDLVIIEEVKIVEIFEEELEEDIYLKNNYSAYIPLKMIEDEKIILLGNNGQSKSQGTKYKLNKNYEKYVYGKGKEFRKWKKINVLYSSKIIAVEEEKVWIDEDEKIVFAI